MALSTAICVIVISSPWVCSSGGGSRDLAIQLPSSHTLSRRFWGRCCQDTRCACCSLALISAAPPALIWRRRHLLSPDSTAWAEVRRTFSSGTRTLNIKDAPGHSPSLQTHDPSQHGWEGARKVLGTPLRVLGTPRECGRFFQGKENIQAISSGWPFWYVELFQHTARNETDDNSTICSSCHHGPGHSWPEKSPPFLCCDPRGPVTEQHQCSSHQDVTRSLLIPKPGHAVTSSSIPLGLAAPEGSRTPYCGRSYRYRGKEASSLTRCCLTLEERSTAELSALWDSHISNHRASRGRF